MKDTDKNDALNNDVNVLKKKTTKKEWLRAISLFACFCIVAGTVFSIPTIQKHLKHLKRVPTYDEPMFSAYEIEDMITYVQRNDFMGPLNSLVVFQEDDDEELVINPITDEQYAEIYRYKGGKSAFRRLFLKEMIYAASNGEVTEIPEKIPTSTSTRIEDYAAGENTLVELRFNDNFNDRYSAVFKLTLQDDEDSKGGKLTFNQKNYCFDANMSDTEIEQSLTPLKNDLSEIFNVSYSEIKINRHNSYWNIYFYNKTSTDDDFLESRVNLDYIEIMIQHNKILITYGTPITLFEEKHKEHIANAKLISLEDAAELLYKGYYYCCKHDSCHCPLCQSDQVGKVNFDRYDHVSFDYSHNSYNESYEYEIGIPYYVFYRSLSDEEYLTWLHGDYYDPNNAYEVNETVYVRAYVPAIEVSGYEEYFAEKAYLRENN